MKLDTTTRTGVRLAGVTLRLGDGDDTITALDAVSLTVAPGELVAVVGPSGAGKSSLLAVAGGLTVPDEGSVTIDGNDLAAMKPAHAPPTGASTSASSSRTATSSRR
ncbi:ATP-binding cassette domain-containing protein [Actinoplanes sp. NPDC026623]|uniref:ATP-binding cassette domain-containing protein n=1 Tax=Actinoplanes sp. NPDC026623 TaxID=3155610 RepID=UPI00340F45AD